MNEDIKAALINIVSSIIDKMTNVKQVARIDKSTENNHPTVQFPIALQRDLVFLGSLFWFFSPQLNSFGSLLSSVYSVLSIILPSIKRQIKLDGEHSGALSN